MVSNGRRAGSMPRRRSIWVSCISMAAAFPKDVVEAARWFHLAAEQGIAKAQVNLGVHVWHLGKGVPKDDVQAYAWMNIGAAQIGDEESGKLLEAIAEEMTASAITKAQSLSREYWEAYGPNRASSE